eukprot:3536131-Amphidinium_carterae.1
MLSNIETQEKKQPKLRNVPGTNSEKFIFVPISSPGSVSVSSPVGGKGCLRSAHFCGLLVRALARFRAIPCIPVKCGEGAARPLSHVLANMKF